MQLKKQLVAMSWLVSLRKVFLETKNFKIDIDTIKTLQKNQNKDSAKKIAGTHEIRKDYGNFIKASETAKSKSLRK